MKEKLLLYSPSARISDTTQLLDSSIQTWTKAKNSLPKDRASYPSFSESVYPLSYFPISFFPPMLLFITSLNLNSFFLI